ncbi:MAG: DUF1893 domain-containing protein [Rikenellaceae bacterium]|nr:DUF1893 domain-containing protein [Rikenellaceae bacterium]
MNVGNITPNLRQQAILRLTQGDCSCVIVNGDRMHVFHSRGVRDLYHLLNDEPTLLHGAFVADKVVGKGAAALMVVGGVVAVFAQVASKSALELLQTSGIPVEVVHIVPHIINRAKTGLCPVEARCAGCRTAEECLPQIEAFLHGQTDESEISK